MVILLLLGRDGLGRSDFCVEGRNWSGHVLIKLFEFGTNVESFIINVIFSVLPREKICAGSDFAVSTRIGEISVMARSLEHHLPAAKSD